MAEQEATAAGEFVATDDPAIDHSQFDREELVQFDQADRQAGGAIGKMLALFFLYTVIVMSIVAWWTYTSTIGE